MTRTLRLAPGLALPLNVVTEVLAFLGRRGQGKSYAAMRLAELMHAAGAQFVALDPVGVWFGLRLAADGKGKGIEVPVFGGLHGDIPLESGAGAIIADLIVDRGLSAVLDVSQFEHDTDKARFAHDFGARLYYRKKQKPSALMLFLEEAQEIVPQNPQKEEARMLHVYTRYGKLGRNYGLGLCLISQRPQEVNKKVLNLAELVFAFQLVGAHERKAVKEWIQSKAIDEDVEAELPLLKRGHPRAWSPAWLQISEVVAISERWTFDASATPEVGHAAVQRPLTPIDLDKLKSDMAATIQKAEAEDPAKLRRQLAEKDRRIRELEKRPEKAGKEKRVEVPMLKDEQIGRLEHLAGRLDAATSEAQSAGERQRKIAEALATGAKELLAVVRTAKAEVVSVQAIPMRVHIPQQLAPKFLPVRAASVDGQPLAAAQRKILNALAFLEAIGVTTPDRTQVALFASLSPTAGHTNNMFGGLRTLGLIEYPTAGSVVITENGRLLADPGKVPQTSEALHQVLMPKLQAAQRKLLTVLIAAYPKEQPRDVVSEEAGLSPTAGHTNNMYGGLRSLGLIDYPHQGWVVACPVLFLDGR